MKFWTALAPLALLFSGTAFAAAAAPAPAAAPVVAAPTPPAVSATDPATIAPAEQSDIEDPVPGPEAAPAVAAPQGLLPRAGLGQPTEGLGLQEQVTEIGDEAAFFHDVWLIPIITVICLITLGLLLWVIARYRRSANAVPSRTTHNTTVEVIWTVLPVALLVAIAFPSLGLLARQYSPPKADLTVKVTGNQWYWTYQYPDHGGFEFVSNMLKECNEVQPGTRCRTAADGPRLLAADERMVVPVGATVKLIITSADVIHAFWVPAFWNKMDAVPGRLNETWFKAERPGVFFGPCTELCGARHAYMPIAVEVTSPERFAAFVAAKGGTMPGSAAAAGQPARPDSTAISPTTGTTSAGAERIAAGEGDETSPAPEGVVDAVEKAPVSEQGAANSRRGGTN